MFIAPAGCDEARLPARTKVNIAAGLLIYRITDSLYGIILS